MIRRHKLRTYIYHRHKLSSVHRAGATAGFIHALGVGETDELHLVAIVNTSLALRQTQMMDKPFISPDIVLLLDVMKYIHLVHQRHTRPLTEEPLPIPSNLSLRGNMPQMMFSGRHITSCCCCCGSIVVVVKWARSVGAFRDHAKSIVCRLTPGEILYSCGNSMIKTRDDTHRRLDEDRKEKHGMQRERWHTPKKSPEKLPCI